MFIFLLIASEVRLYALEIGVRWAGLNSNVTYRDYMHTLF